MQLMHRALVAVFFKLRQGHELERIRTGRFKDDRKSHSGLQCFPPAKRAPAPAVARLQAGKAVLRQGRAQVIAFGL